MSRHINPARRPNGLVIRKRARSVCHAISLTMGILAAPATTPLAAQVGGRSEIFVGSELETYLRLLQIDGRTGLYPWSIRGFSPGELDRMLEPGAAHPWAQRYDLGPRTHTGPSIDWVRPRLTTGFNSTFPYGANDGPVWAGKGLTMALEAGFAARYGPLSLTIAPTVFSARNARFQIQPNGQNGRLRFADGRFSTRIDRPQRFGDGAYTVLDPGQSTLRIDLPLVALGVSTANQHWGPAFDNPILLGNNAAGFPHLFLGSSSPIDLGIAKVHGRLFWGSLSQSDYTNITGSAARRFASGIVGVITPYGIDGLELGAARFFHEQWPDMGLTLGNFAKPLEGILKAGLPDDPNFPGDPGQNTDNQLASVFVRWTFPKSGFEVYGEYGREDHSWDFVDYLLQPDHAAGYMIGFAKVVRSTPAAFFSIRAEVLNLQASSLIRAKRPGGDFYRHGFTRQGHTQRGQVLGSAAGVGGSATVVALDRYHRAGRWTLFWSRELRQNRGEFWITGVRDPDGFDVQHSLGAEALLFTGAFDITVGATGAYNFNRDLGSDAFNLNASLSIRSGIGRRNGTPSRLEAVGSEVRRVAVPEVERDNHPPPDRSSHDLVLTRGHIAERRRLGQLVGVVQDTHRLIRSASLVSGPVSGDGPFRWGAIAPEIEMVWNSDLPFSLNRGSLWAGRGRNTRIRGGFRAEWGKAFVIAAPEYVHSQNLDFALPAPEFTPLAAQMGNPFAYPFHVRPESIDMPIRFGDEPLSKVYPGQSTIGLTTGGLTLGLSTENESWGPGIRNAIVLSENAPGFPHFFVGTATPITTSAGVFRWRVLLGALHESAYFDTLSANDTRSFSAFAATWTPSFLDGLTLGLTRAVYAPADGLADIPDHLFDALLTNPGRPNDRPPGDSTQVPGPDQIYSFFGRWAFANSGFEVYGEWARTELPASLRDLLTAPGHTQGYTLGFQWAKPLRRGRDAFRIQAEHTYLEQSTTVRDRPVGVYYTSRAVLQGYTNEGRVLGAAIGPGASSHWMALDYFGSNWQVGLYGERVRWDNDGFWGVPILNRDGHKWCQHDVTVRGGLRLAYAAGFGRVAASLSRGKRMNVFFQNPSSCPRGLGAGPRNTVFTDIHNTTFEFKYSVRYRN